VGVSRGEGEQKWIGERNKGLEGRKGKKRKVARGGGGGEDEGGKWAW